MSDAVIVAIITGVFAVIGQLLISRSSTKDLYAKLDKQSELSDIRLDAKLDKYQAVTDNKIDELTREVRLHNSYVTRVPMLEEKVSALEKKVG